MVSGCFSFTSKLIIKYEIVLSSNPTLAATGTLNGALTIWDIPTQKARHECKHEVRDLYKLDMGKRLLPVFTWYIPISRFQGNSLWPDTLCEEGKQKWKNF